jgi:hypothetical protein
MAQRVTWPVVGFLLGQGVQMTPLEKSWGSALLWWSAALFLAVVGVLTWEPFLRPHGRGQRMLGLGIASVLGAAVGALVFGGVYWIITKGLTAPTTLVASSENLLSNGGFEEGDKHWGTGVYDDRFRTGHVQRPPQFPYLPFGGADSHGRPDTTEHHGGIASYRIEHRSPKASDVVGSISQRITGLTPHRYYLVTFWVKVTRAESHDAVFLTTDLKWADRKGVGKDPSWTMREHIFFIGDETTTDIRFVAQAPALVWIDDVAVSRAIPVSKSGR